MVIFEGSISRRVFSDQLSEKQHHEHQGIITGLSRICAFTLFVYFFLQIIVLIHGKHWDLLTTPMGRWYLLEMLGFVFLPMVLFFQGYRRREIRIMKVAAVLTMAGVLLNRLNVTIIGFRWDAPVHYYPSWMEIVVSLAVLFTEIWIFRWIVLRLPVLREAQPMTEGFDVQKNENK
jgi:Ni/Fe-hydrogenase subunit HybB-like protein